MADGHGRAYVNSIGFDFPGGEFWPGRSRWSVPRIGPRGRGGAGVPNGMAISPDGSTLVVAESYGESYGVPDRRRRALGEPRTWAATPATTRTALLRHVRRALVRRRRQRALRLAARGGEVVDTVDSDRGAFACALSRNGDPLLLVIGQKWGESAWGGPPTGQPVAFQAPERGDGWP